MSRQQKAYSSAISSQAYGGIMHSGRWLTGTEGTGRLIELRTELDRKDLFMGESGRPPMLTAVYAPWMSSRRIRSEQGRYPYPIPGRVLTLGPHVVESAAELEAFSRYLTRDGLVGLQLIGSRDTVPLR